jgi:hypothetical protein
MADEVQDNQAVAQSTDGADTKIDVKDAPVEQVNTEQPAGVPEGTVEKTDSATDPEVALRIEHEEKVVYDKDADGKVVGWHKEAVGE